MSLINAAGNNSSNSRPSCTYCGKDNHTIDRCYRKNGPPQNYPSKGGNRTQRNFGKGNFGAKGNKVCTHCGLSNHTIDDCYKKHGYPPGHKLYKVQNPNINNVNTIREEGNGSPLDRNQETQNEDVILTTQQYKVLMSLLQQQAPVQNNSQINEICTVTNRDSILFVTCSVSKISGFLILEPQIMSQASHIYFLCVRK